jgi:hypothetical protein
MSDSGSLPSTDGFRRSESVLRPNDLEVAVSPGTSEAWRHSLSDCTLMKGTVIEVGPPKHYIAESGRKPHLSL